MPRNAELFHIAMTVYAFGFIAAVVCYRPGDPVYVSNQQFLKRAPLTHTEGIAKAGYEAPNATSMPLAPRKHEKKI